jgi:GNAT superfamily N-acetyltransferase
VSIRLIQPQSEQTWRQARVLIEEYAATLDLDLSFQERLYTVPAARGRGAGRQLAEGIVAAARRIGYAKLLLDTLPGMREAVSLYASLGFKPTVAYRFNPVPDAVFLELQLR